MEVNSINRSNPNKTENGTTIVKPGEEADKDIFFKLLVAQMGNQDPFNAQDPTQYITQLAQFTMLERIEDLNDSMQYLVGVNNGVLVNSALETASSLIGKEVEVSSPDKDGKFEDYSGTVKSVSIKNGIVYLDVEVEDGEIKEFEYASLVKVKENSEIEK